MIRGPTVEQIVDQILTLSCGERCDITLNPRITRVDNLKWLLPVCVEQFGTRITIDQHAQDSNVVLSITATASRKPAVRQRAAAEPPAVVEVRERVVGERLAPADEREPASVSELEAVAIA